MEDNAIVGAGVEDLGGGVVCERGDELVVALDDAGGGLGVGLVEREDVAVQVDGKEVLALPEGAEHLGLDASFEGEGPVREMSDDDGGGEEGGRSGGRERGRESTG